ncbi:MAG TPA: acyl-CoA dehydrogenase family protein [Streptosporangiaceae bacterium]
MDFLPNDIDLELAALTRSILAGGRHGGGLAEPTAGGAGRDDGRWADLAKAGVLSASLPESLGGFAAGLLAQCAVLTEIGRAVAPVPYLDAIVLGAGAVARFGTPEQQRRWAEPAGRGELLLAAALAEPDGDDPARPSATATPAAHPSATATPAAHPSTTAAPGGWLLSGVKTMVAAAPEADWLLVPAATPDGSAVFLVDAGQPGVTVQRQQATGGLSTGQLVMADVIVPGDQLLGSGPDGLRAVAWLAAHGTVGLCAVQLGILERALEMTAEYTQSRVQFGRPIGTFQAVRQRLADAYTDVEAVRLTMWQAAWQLAAGRPAGTAIATAKFWAADAGHRVAHTAVHLHGGVGIDVSYPLHRYFTAAKRCEFALGGATTQLRHIGAALAQSS